MFTLLKENSNGKHVVRGVTYKTQAIARRENVSLETWIKIGKATQKRERERKTSLDNARRLNLTENTMET